MSEVHSFLQWFKQYFQSSTSSTLVFWYVLVISCWTVLGLGLYVYPNSVWWSYCSLQNLKSHASSMFIYSLALCSYDSLLVYPAYVAVPSQMLSAVFSSSYVLLPLLSLSYIPNPWLHPLATVTGPCCSELRVLLFCLLLDQSPSHTLTLPVLIPNSWVWSHARKMYQEGLTFLRWTVYFVQLYVTMMCYKY